MSGERILIVDDETDLRSVLVEALGPEGLGYQTVGSASAEEAILEIGKEHFPVVFTDLNMPGGMSGLDLLKKIRELDPKTLVILMTGFATTDNAIKALKHGAYDFIQKPFRLGEIDVALQRALEYYRLQRMAEEYQESLERAVKERTQEILQLKDNIERLFEGFVNASVVAIEARDPTTSGHSARVAELTVGLTEIVNESQEAPFAEVHFSQQEMRELRYAALLHDFGKVAVREKVLVKAKKLEPERMDMLLQRFQAREKEILLQRIYEAWVSGRPFDSEYWQREREDVERQTSQFIEIVRKANEPTVLPQDTSEGLDQVGALEFTNWEGVNQKIVDPNDLATLKIPKGSLSEEERLEVERHVTESYRFLSQIPWTQELAGVPTIAYGHHERLNGRGYPRKLMSDEIPLQAKIMAICDVYDALSARDRPYKAALSLERSLNILKAEAENGLLDKNLLKLFVEKEVFHRTKDWDLQTHENPLRNLD